MSFGANPLISAGLSLLSGMKGSKAQRQGASALNQNTDYLKGMIPNQWTMGSNVGGVSMTPDGRIASNFDSPFRRGLMGTQSMYDQAFWGSQGFNPYQAIYSNLGNQANRFAPYEAQQASLGTDWNALRDKVAPGYSQIRDVRRTALDDAETQATGNLRSALQQRNVAGSSFANQDLSGLAANFGRARADSEAKTFLEELDATQKIYTGEANQALQAANMLANRIATQLKAADAGRGTVKDRLEAQRLAAQGRGAVQHIGLTGDLRHLAELMGGQRGMMNFIANMANVISGNASELAQLKTSAASGWGSLLGQTLPNIMPQYNSWTGSYSNPWKTS